jgi:hypothetical protein
MNGIRTACMIGAVTTLVILLFQPSFSSAADPRVLKLKRSVESQVERVKAARERVDAKLTVSQIRSVEQLRRSQEELIRQSESSQRVRELLQEQLQESGSGDLQKDPEAAQQVYSAFADIEAEINQLRQLINQMDVAIKAAEATSGTDSGTSTGGCQSPTTTPWATPCGSGGTATSSVPTEISLTLSEVAPPPPGEGSSTDPVLVMPLRPVPR